MTARYPKCKHGVTIGANCGKCQDAKKRQAGYREGWADAIDALLSEARELRAWAANNHPTSDMLGGRGLIEAEKLEWAAAILQQRTTHARSK